MSKQTLRILHLAKWYPHKDDPQNGVFIQKQIQACSDIAEHAVLYWGTDDEYHWSYDKEEGIATLRAYFPRARRIQNVNRKWSSIPKLLELAWGGHKPDMVHLHVADNDQWVALEYARANRIPVVLTEHWSGYLDGRFDRRNTLSKSLTQALIRRVDTCTTVSDFLADAIISATGRKEIEIVPNVVDTEGYLSVPANESSVTFGVLSDLDDKIKNISGVLKAFREYLKENESAFLRIIGDGSDRHKLEKLAEEMSISSSVEFLGRMTHKESIQALTEVETVIVNSRRETFSVVCLEAIALGKKLICTRCGGPETFLLNSLVEWVHPDDDIDLLRAMRKTADLSFPTQEGIIRQLEDFLPEVIAERWQSIYMKLNAAKGGK